MLFYIIRLNRTKNGSKQRRKGLQMSSKTLKMRLFEPLPSWALTRFCSILTVNLDHIYFEMNLSNINFINQKEISS